MASRGLQPSFYDSIASLAHDKFVQLLATLPELLSGKKVLAAMIMKTSADDAGCVVSLGTGNRCITGELMSLEGLTVNDSHAEIITRRGLLRFEHLSLSLAPPAFHILKELSYISFFKRTDISTTTCCLTNRMTHQVSLKVDVATSSA